VIRWIVAAACAFAPAEAFGQESTLVPVGALWRHLDDGSDAGTAWRGPLFDDSGWAEGPAQLGYGDGDEATLIQSGPEDAHFVTTYFRHRFEIPSAEAVEKLTLSLLRDDGAVVYLNGVEVFRTNLAAGPIDASTLALSNVSSAGEDRFHTVSVSPCALANGSNVLAVEVHQASPTSADVSFDLSLLADATPPVLARSPYLQRATARGVVLRWRTQALSRGRVRFGPAPDQLGSIRNSACGTDHQVVLQDLSPATRYYYSVGSFAHTLAGGDGDHWFETLPLPGAATRVRIWVVGDSGDCAQGPGGCDNAAAVQDAYFAAAGGDLANVWLLLGDNAYTQGTDREYTDGLFAPFSRVLRNTVAWPSPGNHEFGASDSPTGSGPYYDAFELPTLSESGGLASLSEAYYSFDHGPVHFVSLDSSDTDRSVGGPMHAWLEADLAANAREWVIVYWHHPPYTLSSHDSDRPSDSSGKMIEMRERFLPLLEAHGVDLVLTGHSHSYERSIQIDGHYGFSNTFDPQLHAVDAGDGDPEGDGPYRKPQCSGESRGAVYAVVGSSSKNGGELGAHPVMAVGIDYEGSLLVDVDGDRLDARFIDRDGVLGDRFQIVHGLAPCCDGIDGDGDGLVDHPDDPGCSLGEDETERSPLLPCDDGIDGDGDGRLDFPHDVGCQLPTSPKESPACSDGRDNDGDGALDFDGGAWVNGGVPLGDPDLVCGGEAWFDREYSRGCGLGSELGLVLAGLWAAFRLSAAGRGRPSSRPGSPDARGGAPSRAAP
jgi:hypothetical protein